MRSITRVVLRTKPHEFRSRDDLALVQDLRTNVEELKRAHTPFEDVQATVDDFAGQLDALARMLADIQLPPMTPNNAVVDLTPLRLHKLANAPTDLPKR